VIYCKTHLRDHQDKRAGSSFLPDSASFVPVSKEGKTQSGEVSDAVVAKMRSYRETGNSNKCGVCEKTVYLAEKIDVEIKGDKKIYHKGCFRCSSCGLALNLRNYGSFNGILFCIPHLKEKMPQMAKSSDAYFLSPLKAQDPEKLNSEELNDTTASLLNEKVIKKETMEESEPNSKTEREKNREERRKQREEDLKRVEEMEGKRTREQETNSTEIGDDDRSRREKEREERKKKREEEMKNDEQEFERRKKEREERQLRRQQEAEKEEEEAKKKSEERRKKLQQIKNEL